MGLGSYLLRAATPFWCAVVRGSVLLDEEESPLLSTEWARPDALDWGISKDQVDAYRSCVRDAVRSRAGEPVRDNAAAAAEPSETVREGVSNTPVDPPEDGVIAINPSDAGGAASAPAALSKTQKDVWVSVDLEKNLYVRVPVLVEHEACSFATFKQDRDYRIILEHVPAREGFANRAWADLGARYWLGDRGGGNSPGGQLHAGQDGDYRYQYFYPPAISMFWARVRQTNWHGAPVVTKFRPPVNELSATVLRYAREVLIDLAWVVEEIVAAKAQRISGAAKNPAVVEIRVAEIGVGHGGLAHTLFSYVAARNSFVNASGSSKKNKQQVVELAQYTLVDLPEVQELAFLQLQAMDAGAYVAGSDVENEEEPRIALLAGYAEEDGASGAVTFGNSSAKNAASARAAATGSGAAGTEDGGRSLFPARRRFGSSRHRTSEGDTISPQTSTGDKPLPPPDLCISHYAFSELRSRKLADFYVQQVFAFCDTVELQYIPEFAPGLSIDLDKEYLRKIGEVLDNAVPFVRPVVPAPAGHPSSKLALFFRGKDLSVGHTPSPDRKADGPEGAAEASNAFVSENDPFFGSGAGYRHVEMIEHRYANRSRSDTNASTSSPAPGAHDEGGYREIMKFPDRRSSICCRRLVAWRHLLCVGSSSRHTVVTERLAFHRCVPVYF